MNEFIIRIDKCIFWPRNNLAADKKMSETFCMGCGPLNPSGSTAADTCHPHPANDAPTPSSSAACATSNCRWATSRRASLLPA